MSPSNEPAPIVDRAVPSPELIQALRDQYGFDAVQTTDLGGVNLNLAVEKRGERYVARVYMPWVTAQRLADIRRVRDELGRHGVPCAELVSTRAGEPCAFVDGRLVEVERFVERDADMDTWERLETGLPILGRIHAVLWNVDVSADGRKPRWANHVEPHEALEWTLAGTGALRRWANSAEELRLADASEQLAHLLRGVELDLVPALRRQLVHGDFWDNNVFFRNGRVVLVVDFDFMGERARIDDLALTLFYTNSTFSEDPLSVERISRLRRLADAYESGLDDRLTAVERLSLPLAIARTVLCFIGMVPFIDEARGRRHVASRFWDVEWALRIVHDLNRWQDAFA